MITDIPIEEEISHNMDRSELPELLTVKETARFLRISETTVRRWARTGILAAAPIGDTKYGHYRFYRDTLLEMVKPANIQQQA
jgi:excisionase family DNA binding protein